jgi:hypothetical protein
VFLPSLLGTLEDLTGTYATGLACFALCTAGICILLLEFGVGWTRSWPSAALVRARIFSYRESGGKAAIAEAGSE